jgi:hypothetical protein
VPRIAQEQAHAGIEESELAIAVLELLEIIFGDLEGGGEARKVTRVPFLPFGRAEILSGATASPNAKRM